MAMQQVLRMRLGTPWWLASLNVIAIAVTTVAVALAFGAVAAGPLAESAIAKLAFADLPSDSVRVVTLLASAAALWFGLRLVPFARAFGSAWL